MTQLARENLSGTQSQAAAVIVIGAGVGGLQTACKLQQAGISCLVLEPSGQICGQAFSNNFSVEHHPRTHALATGLGLVDGLRSVQGKATLESFAAFEHDQQPALDAEDAASLVKVKTILDTLSLRRDDPQRDVDMTVEQLVSSCGATDTVAEMANLWTRTIFGLSSNNVSASQFLSQCDSCGGLGPVLDNMYGLGDNLAVPELSHQIATAMAQHLSSRSLHLNQEVDRVEHGDENTCIIYTKSGNVFHGNKIVLAGSLSSCSSLDIAPPPAAVAPWETMKEEQGFSTTVDIVFDHPWWQQRGLSGHAQGLTGPIAQVRPSGLIATDGLYALSCQVAGEQARGMWLWLMSDEEREMLLVQHLSAIFGGAIPRAVQVVERDQDALVSGQQSLHLAGENAGQRGRHRWTSEGNVHFAGADTSHVWRGYLEGALVAGERAAAEIMAVVGAAKPMEMAPRL
ncbi:mao-B, putative [Cordyceps militaris CM01]|uniref:Amine oxidase n=1 Tax=Cordyceps militaris (strain CM01) TaxID=983644 RepID=G3J7M2_CORMM|nr:mao-B, putative [Cordyceps militaris CM01]EGX95488.1 mao-B, putative [Cordyceps militaris CM01]